MSSFGFGWMLGFGSFDGGANWIINRLRFVFLEIPRVLKFGIDERFVTVLADENFVGHSFCLILWTWGELNPHLSNANAMFYRLTTGP